MRLWVLWMASNGKEALRINMPLCLCDPRKRTSHANSHLSALPGQKKYFQVRSRRTQQLHRKLFVQKKKATNLELVMVTAHWYIHIVGLHFLDIWFVFSFHLRSRGQMARKPREMVGFSFSCQDKITWWKKVLPSLKGLGYSQPHPHL